MGNKVAKKQENMAFETNWFACPGCSSERIDWSGTENLVCADCNESYPVKNGIPVFFGDFLKSEEIDEKDFWESGKNSMSDGSFKTMSDDAYRSIISQFQLPDSGLGLEFASGSGAFADFIEGGPQMLGLDISYTLLESATSLIPVQGSGENLPFRKDLFDFVICAAALHHMPDVGKAVSEIAKVLKPGGYICIMELNVGHPQRKLVASPDSFWRKVFASTGFSPSETLIPTKKLKAHLKDNNFDIEEFTYITPKYRRPSTVGKIQEKVSEIFGNSFLKKVVHSYVVVRAKYNP